MRIEKIEAFLVRPRWCFVKITTDTGLFGWGEAVLEGKAETVRAAVYEMADYLIGKDPARIEDIWNTLYRAAFYRGGGILMSAISGIDQRFQVYAAHPRADSQANVFGHPGSTAFSVAQKSRCADGNPPCECQPGASRRQPLSGEHQNAACK